MRVTLLPIVAAGFLVLAGCSTPADAPGGASPSPQPVTVQSPAGPGAPQPATTPGPGSVTPSSEAPAQTAAPLELTTAAGTTVIAPTAVYCSGSPGQLRHLVAKTNDQPPIVEVTPGEFAMVKLGRGQPFKSAAPSGMTVEDDSITFAGTALGDATLTGTVTCTTWQD